MLVLSRKPKQQIRVDHKGETLIINLFKISGKVASVAFDGPASFQIVRSEVYDSKIDSSVAVRDGDAVLPTG